MDNIPKENEPGKSQTGGEIFSPTSSQSDYQEAAAAPEQTQNSPSEQYPQQEKQPTDGIPNGIEGGSIPPPPYHEEDKKKKIIIFGAFGIAIILLIALVINFLFGSKPKAPQTVTLNYWGLWEDSEIMQPIIDDYKKTHSNININYVKQDPKQYRDRLKVALDKGEGPDIFRYHNTWVQMMKSYLSPMPLNIYTSDDFKKTFFPVASADLILNENIYGVPLMIDGLILFYNEDIFKGANISVPVTWEDVQKILPKITVKQGGKIVTAGIALGTAENIEHFSDILGLMFLQNGTQLSKSFFSCTNTSSTTCGTDTLTYYRKFADKPNNTWDDTLENSIVAFAGGKVGMVIAPSWQAFTIKELSKNSKLNFKTAKVPQLPCDKETCASTNWATYWVEGVSSKSKFQKEAWDFLKYLSDPNTMKKLYELQSKSRVLFGEPYSRVDLSKLLSDHPYLAPVMQEAPTMKSFYLASRTNDGDTGFNSRLITYLKNAVNSLSTGSSIESALKTADSGFNQVYLDWKLTAPVPTQ